MLRVTVLEDGRGTTFKLEGKLAHEWVAEAEKAWLALFDSSRQERIVVDLCGVSFVDDHGRDLLVRMHAAGARLVGTGLTVSALIEEVCGEAQSSRSVWLRNVLSLLFLAQAGTAAGSHRIVVLHYARSFSPEQLLYTLPGWLVSLQVHFAAFWKGLLR